MGTVEVLTRGMGAAVAGNVALFRTDQPVLVVIALLLLTLLVVDTFRPAAHR